MNRPAWSSELESTQPSTKHRRGAAWKPPQAGCPVHTGEEAGGVPFLRVANGADQPLLLLDGEGLIGAKQNRTLNTVLTAAHAEVTTPVNCVEQKRWGSRGRRFRPGDTSLLPFLRARKVTRVSQSPAAGTHSRPVPVT